MFYRETLDPTPDVHALFHTFNFKFFKGSLTCVELEWSVKMYQCAGICYSRRNRIGMACVIRLSEPLLKLRSRKDLVETLLHEMIHAWNFIRGINEENGGHGQNFLGKMHEINRLAGTNISVYHTFIDEVNVYKTHWWRCDGPCKERAPYFGFVKRTCNRAPGKSDSWWQRHQQTCGGSFIKVKEPEKVEKKRKGKENTKKKPTEPPLKAIKTSPGADIRKFFKPDQGKHQDTPSSSKTVIVIPKIEDKPKLSGSSSSSGVILGGKSSGRSRLLDMFPDKKAKTEKLPKKVCDVIEIDEEFPVQIKTSWNDRVKLEFDDDDDVIIIDGEFDDSLSSNVPTIKAIIPKPSDICHCPCCNKLIEVEKINEHLDHCLNL